jgi:hypothetical protein
MNPALLMVSDVLTNEASQKIFVHRDHMIERLSVAVANPAVRIPFCHRACTPVRFGVSSVDFRVAVENHVSMAGSLAQLLHNPLGPGLRRDMKCRTRRRPCIVSSSSTEAEKSNAGTVKKSIGKQWRRHLPPPPEQNATIENNDLQRVNTGAFRWNLKSSHVVRTFPLRKLFVSL